MVEVVVDRGVNGGELLQGLDVPEFRHRPLSSSERLMRVFGPVVEPATAHLNGSITDHFHRRILAGAHHAFDSVESKGRTDVAGNYMDYNARAVAEARGFVKVFLGKHLGR